jgi:hypothetical protein
MKTLLIAFSLILIGCGKTKYKTQTNETIVEKEIKVEVEKEVMLEQDFEGYWICDNNSNVEILVDYNNRATFETTGQSINSVNPDNDTLGTFPVISERDVIINNQKLLIAPRNYTFNKNTHDIEKDLGGDIDGSRRVDWSFVLKKHNKLHINVKVYDGAINNNINKIIVDRTIKCEL